MSNDTNEERDELQAQLDCISIEMSRPLAQTIAYTKRIIVTGDSEESKQSRFGMALDRVILERLVLLDKLSMPSKLACFTVSIGIKAESWCKTCSIEYEPDCIFVEQKDPSAMPNPFGAVAMVEIAWKNRPFLDQPAAIDLGLLFQELQSYVMADFTRRRLVLFRRANNWQPETFVDRHLPSKIDGLDFEIDWQRAYANAGLLDTRFSYLRRCVRYFMGGFRSAPE